MAAMTRKVLWMVLAIVVLALLSACSAQDLSPLPVVTVMPTAEFMTATPAPPQMTAEAQAVEQTKVAQSVAETMVPHITQVAATAQAAAPTQTAVAAATSVAAVEKTKQSEARSDELRATAVLVLSVAGAGTCLLLAIGYAVKMTLVARQEESEAAARLLQEQRNLSVQKAAVEARARYDASMASARQAAAEAVARQMAARQTAQPAPKPLVIEVEAKQQPNGSGAKRNGSARAAKENKDMPVPDQHQASNSVRSPQKGRGPGVDDLPLAG